MSFPLYRKYVDRLYNSVHSIPSKLRCLSAHFEYMTEYGTFVYTQLATNKVSWFPPTNIPGVDFFGFNKFMKT